MHKVLAVFDARIDLDMVMEPIRDDLQRLETEVDLYDGLAQRELPVSASVALLLGDMDATYFTSRHGGT